MKGIEQEATPKAFASPDYFGAERTENSYSPFSLFSPVENLLTSSGNRPSTTTASLLSVSIPCHPCPRRWRTGTEGTRRAIGSRARADCWPCPFVGRRHRFRARGHTRDIPLRLRWAGT